MNAVKGFTREELVECLLSPLREPSEFLAAFEKLEKSAWYIHHTPEASYYFDRRENLTKVPQSLAKDAPENRVDDLIRHRLPWNPSRLEQRLGRIKRFGQTRRAVDMLNLVYSNTRDEKVYRALSRRMKDRFDIFGGLPDTIEDDWIANIEYLEEMMDTYVHLCKKARATFELRYKETIDPDKNRWELCSLVLARTDLLEKLSEAW